MTTAATIHISRGSATTPCRGKGRPRPGKGSPCRDAPAKSKSRPAIAASRSSQSGRPDGEGGRGGGSVGSAIRAPSPPFVGGPPSPRDSKPAVALRTPLPVAAARRIPELSTRTSDMDLCVAGCEACAWSAARSRRRRCAAPRSRPVGPPRSSLRISRRMRRMTRARNSGEACASNARSRAMLARTWRPDSIRSSSVS